MRALLCAAACSGLLAAARGHGAMYEPPSRSSRGIPWMTPGCAGGSCFWYTIGSSIGCPKSGGPPTNPEGRVECLEEGHGACCDHPAEPTIGNDPLLRTYNVDGNNSGYPCSWGECGDWTKTNPWRKPGSAPVLDPCGAAGGAAPFNCSQPGGAPVARCVGNESLMTGPPLAAQGDPASKLPKLLHKTVWIAGSTAEVAWGILANHGGGYSYRLCPAGSELTEECFQKMPLDFDGDTSWIQFGPDGMDASNRTGFKASQVSEGTVPAGSQWRRNPVPACAGGVLGTGGGTDPNSCRTPLFPPPVPGVFGFGLGGAPSRVISATAGVVDRVRVPRVPPGEYVLGFRWDCEQTGQVWQSCGDVVIKEDGEPTVPFTPLSGCDPCCGDGICANCTGCINNMTGECAYCWEQFPSGFYNLGPALNKVLRMSCLGHEDPRGGPSYAGFTPADLFHPLKVMKMLNGFSPGCPKCWAEKDACTPRERS